jgi:hypothetical protein
MIARVRVRVRAYFLVLRRSRVPSYVFYRSAGRHTIRIRTVRDKNEQIMRDSNVKLNSSLEVQAMRTLVCCVIYLFGVLEMST